MDVFYALAEPTRRSIIETLADSGQLPASAIARKFRSSPSAISQHLKVLREAKLVRMEKRKQQRIYYLNPEAIMELENWARQMTRRYDVLEAMLQKERNNLSRKDKQDGKN